MTARPYLHEGRRVQAMRFVGNGPDVAAWAGSEAVSHGQGLSGSLTVFVNGLLTLVDPGDWVVRSADGWLSLERQEIFATQYREVRNADA